MDIRVYDLPTLNQGRETVEKRLNELENMYRRGEQLDEIEIDWIDTANTWLMTTGETNGPHRRY